MHLLKTKTKLLLLNSFSFLLGFQGAFIAYVTSSFLEQRSGLGNVGVFYILSYAASLVVLFNVHHLVIRYGKSNVFIVFVVMKMLGLLGVGLFANSSVGVIFIVWTLMAGPLVWVGLDILIESFSCDKITGTIRGEHLSIMNFGWLLAPFLAAWIVGHTGFAWVYLGAALFAAIVLVIAVCCFRNVNHNMRRDLKFAAIVKKMYRRKNIARIYYVSFMLEFFYAAMVMYTPLLLLEQGYSWERIGVIFTVMLIPFVIFQYPMGVLADKKTGEKEWLMVAVVIMVVFTGLISFAPKADVQFWMITLFLTRVGAAIVEVLRDSYFYKQIKAQDVDLIDFYRTTRSLSYIAVAGIFSLYLLAFPLRSIFVVLAIIIATALIPLYKLQDSK